ncbi:hypothetical protein B0H14DRAFT_3153478 [Mycena olivaceomarginata]|nr:hypothetical protein B0H14DRAFT_3153478 [Mycena olivaceomarginata]
MRKPCFAGMTRRILWMRSSRMKTTPTSCGRRDELMLAARRLGDARILDFRVQTAEMHRIKALAKMQKEARSLHDNSSRVLVPLSEMDALKIPETHEQLNVYRAKGVPDILVNRKYPGKAEKLAVLKDAFQWFEANGTLPVFLSIP